MYKKKKITKTKEKHICSECIGEFDGKDLFSALVPDREYYTNYCEKCIKKLGIKEYTPYFKPTVRKHTVKISEVREWLKKLNIKEKNKLTKKYFDDKDFKSLVMKDLKELYTKEHKKNE